MPVSWTICPRCGGTEKYKNGSCKNCIKQNNNKKLWTVCPKCGGSEKTKRNTCKKCFASAHARRSWIVCPKCGGTKKQKQGRCDSCNITYLRLRGGWAPGESERAERLKVFITACACCGSSSPRYVNGWSADHDHETGLFRGFLCMPCNIRIGYGEKYSLGFSELELCYLNLHHSLKVVH